jgi:VanZ family protein
MRSGGVNERVATDLRGVTKATGIGTCALAVTYGIAVVYGSLLPLDFVAQPLDRILPLYLQSASVAPRWSITDVLVNVVLFVPLAFLAFACPRLRDEPIGAFVKAILVVAMCALLAAGVEFAQLYFPPRYSSLRDLLANAIGGAIGVALAAWFGPNLLMLGERVCAPDAFLPPANPNFWRMVLAGVVLYVIALGAAAGIGSGPWNGASAVFGGIGQLVDAPFRTHVAADTFLAIFSATVWFAAYAPIGIAMRYLFARSGPPRVSTVMALTALLALAIEAAKLFVVGKTADTGNVVIAAFGAGAGFLVAPFVFGFRIDPRVDTRAPQLPMVTGGPGAKTPENADAAEQSGVRATAIGARALAILFAVATLALVATYPLRPTLLALALLIYASVLVRWPATWLWVVPAALPVVDLTPLTGRFFLDEFDALVLVTLAVGAWQVGSGRMRVSGSMRAMAWLAPLAVSVCVSLAIGVWPLEPLDANAFASYFGHYNALRVAKGFAWSCSLVPLLVAAANDGVDIRRRFAAGTVAGLAGVVALALWERAAYPGLLDFARDFRIGAFVSSMHIGGGHIETYLLLGMPFLLPFASDSKSAGRRAGCVVLFLLATYAVMVTFSRAAYAGYVAMVILLLVASALHAERRSRARRLLGTVAVATFGFIVAAPIVTGAFATSRFADIDADFQVRVRHWRDAFNMKSPDMVTQLLGTGLGQYPLAYLYGNREGHRPVELRYEREGDDTFLRLGAGEPFYVEQIVDVNDGRRYRLTLRLRAQVADAPINVLLCERTYFHSYGCESATFTGGGRPGTWELREATIDSGRLGAGTWPLRRAVKLSLENASQGVADIDDVSLVDDAGRELVANGGFNDGSARWYFSSNVSHLAWHIKNLWLGLLFEQGALGVLSFGLVIFVAGVGAWRGARVGDLYAAAALAALVAFLIIGLFDTLVDAPRLTLMLFLTLFATGTVFDPLARSRSAMPVATARRVDSPDAAESAGAGTPATPDYAASARQHLRLGPRALRSTTIAIAIIACAIALVTRLPFVPYNLRDLPNPFHPIAAPIVLAVFFVWVSAAPGWIVVAWQRERATAWCFPLLIAVHGVVAWWIVRFGALPEMVHKVTGSPVLKWPWELETLVRFAVLEGTLFALLSLGALAAGARRRLVPLRTLGLASIWICALLAVAYRVIIVDAATDNLTELIDQDAPMAACAALAAAVVLAGYVAGRLAEGSLNKGIKVSGAVALVAMSAIASFALLWAGTAPSLSKYGSDFSALQFILSADRSRYAGPLELIVRLAVVQVVLVVALAWAQRPAWRIVASASPIRDA